MSSYLNSRVVISYSGGSRLKRYAHSLSLSVSLCDVCAYNKYARSHACVNCIDFGILLVDHHSFDEHQLSELSS